MIRQFASLLFGLVVLVGMQSMVYSSVLPEGSLILGGVLADDSPIPDSATPEVPSVPGLEKESAAASNQSNEVHSNQVRPAQVYSEQPYVSDSSNGNYFQTAYSQAYEAGEHLLTKGCCPHCHCVGCNCYNWQAYVGALWWQRTSPGGGVTVMERQVNGNGTTTLLESKDYDFGWSNGWEVGLKKRLNCTWAAEANFYRVDSFDAGCNTCSDHGAEVPFVVPIVTEFEDCLIDSTYSSELTNFELNLRRHVSQRIDLVAGFRYIQLNDRYRMGFIGENNELYSIHTFNNMYGFHIGPDVCLVNRGPFCVEWGTRLGVYGNRIDNGVCATQDAITLGRCKASQDHTAFSADMELAGTYQYNDCLAVRFGYQVLWLEGVGEATAQIGSLAPLTERPSGVDTDGSPFYHGAFVDLVLTW